MNHICPKCGASYTTLAEVIAHMKGCTTNSRDARPA